MNSSDANPVPQATHILQAHVLTGKEWEFATEMTPCWFLHGLLEACLPVLGRLPAKGPRQTAPSLYLCCPSVKWEQTQQSWVDSMV